MPVDGQLPPRPVAPGDHPLADASGQPRHHIQPRLLREYQHVLAVGVDDSQPGLSPVERADQPAHHVGQVVPRGLDALPFTVEVEAPDLHERVGRTRVRVALRDRLALR